MTLIDTNLRKLIKELHILESKEIKVGLLGSAGSDIVKRGGYQEFGTSRGIPERPFIRPLLEEHQGEVKARIQSEVNGVLQGGSAVTALNRVGNFSKGKIQQIISEKLSPPLAASTIKAKGSSKPLIDTGQMRASVNFEVI